MTIIRTVTRRAPGSGGGGSSDSIFPLSVSSNGRYLQDAQGDPFLLNGDTPWMLAHNCTDEIIDSYLEGRAALGFNAILFEGPGACFSTQSPLYNNVDGQPPFTSTSYTACSWTSLNEPYWERVDHLVNKALELGILCLFCPAYSGQGGGLGDINDQGWGYQMNVASDADLQTYGQLLATRYDQPNIVWAMGGDYNGLVAKHWQIVAGIRSVRPNDLFTFHGGRTTPGYTPANGQPGFAINNIYTDGTEYTYAASEYARSPAMPFFLIEGWYENDGNLTAQGYRRQAWATMLGGGCGHLMGHNDIWGFGGYGSATAEGTLALLNSTLAQDLQRMVALLESYSWHLLQPKTDTSFVTTSLGTGTSRIIPALASDGSFGMIWTPSQNFTVDMSALSPSSVRGRWFDPTTGSFTAASGSPYANTGTQAFTAPGERVLVLDAA